MNVAFTYKFMGAEYTINATIRPGLYRASMSGPDDDEPEIMEIEAIGPDGEDYYGEFHDIFTRATSPHNRFTVKMVSIASLIDQAAYDEWQVAA